MRSKKWRRLIISLILIAVVSAAFVFQGEIMLYLAPKAVLTSALTDVIDQLEVRFQDDPAQILLGALDPQGNYTAKVDLSSQNPLLGTIQYRMNLQTNASLHQLQGEGTAQTDTRELDLRWYMDPNYIALASEDLVGGQYYGITYDSFSQDLHSIPLVDFFISDALIQQWDDSLQEFRFGMLACSLPQLPQLTGEELRSITLGVLALPCQQEKRAVSTEDGFMECHVLSYTLDQKLMDQLLPDGGCTQITADFYLNEGTLLSVLLRVQGEEEKVFCRFEFTEDPLNHALTLHTIHESKGVAQETSTRLTTRNSQETYAQSFEIHKTSGDQYTEERFSYEYLPSSGNMKITSSRGDAACTLRATEEGFFVESEDLRKLMKLLWPQGAALSDDQIPGSVTISKGSEILAPQYKNLDQWSMEDFWELLSGVGALIGIRIPT